ncbi:DUF998 domain-containing protein [Actinoplanes utahensis]|uniref:DUF998 domain-containing protein n=1 Tax=Actinoplanes utahensis TaxID=1869 RepID=UPI00068C806F|nr:DUF998 domain-containing protein [Actinoplanes utahensis]GIF32617.1 hypothetical protein Aut01nite_56030 [Actinoplanes utahensis]
MRRRLDTVPAGLAGFVAAAGLADLLNPGWSPVERMVSHYVHGRAGWLIPLALLSLAVASGVLLRRIAGHTRDGRAGLWSLGAWTAAVLLGAVFPADPYGRWHEPPTTAGMVHGAAALVAFTVLPVAAVLLTRTLEQGRARPAGRLLRVMAAATVAACLILVVAFLDVSDGPSLTAGPWESLVGLAERLTLWTYVAWLAVASSAVDRRAAPSTARSRS